jgi:hypothetical protein
MLHDTAYFAQAAADADFFFLINSLHPVSFYILFGGPGLEA